LATGKANARSDIDLYIYANGAIPIETRAEVIESRSSRMELNAPYWETEDYWIERRAVSKWRLSTEVFGW
jgi:predicted nucleotidyltransferase